MERAVTEHHKDEKTKPKPLTIDTDADETDAFTDEESSTAALRVGSVVAVMPGTRLSKDRDLPSFAKVRVDRITTAATGKNPDA